jgi:hypothetical protein
VFTRTDAGRVVHEDVHTPTGEHEVGSEAEEELQDVLAPRYDQLERGRGGSSSCCHCCTAISRTIMARRGCLAPPLCSMYHIYILVLRALTSLTIE